MTNQNCVWPGGDEKPVCMFIYSHQEFSEKMGLVFERGVDDLDEYFGSFVVDQEIGPVKFLEYTNAPVSGVVAYVDSLIKTPDAVARIKAKFKLSDSDVSWIRE